MIKINNDFKILIYENSKKNLEMFKQYLCKIPVDIRVDIIFDYDEALHLYHKSKYFVVFINMVLDKNKELSKYILNKNEKQKIIEIYDDFFCDEIQGCDFCKKTYNKLRLQSPITEVEIKDILTNKFICDEYLNNNLLSKIKHIYKLTYNGYFTYTLDENNLIFLNKNEKENINDLLFIVEKLKFYDINYIINEKRDICILS